LDRTRAEDLPLGQRVRAFAFLMAIEFFYGWTWNTVDLLRPQLRQSLGLTLTQAGSAYTAQGLGALVGAIVLGQVADRFGRRRTLFGVIGGFGVVGIAGALVPSYPWMLAQRFVLGFFLGAIFPVLIGTYMGLFPSRVRGRLAAVGQGCYNLSVVALGRSIGLVAAADWHALLWAGALPPLLLAPLLFWAVPDDRRVAPWGAGVAPRTSLRLPIVELFRPALRRRTGLLFLLVGLNFFAYQAFSGWVTTFLEETRHIDAGAAGDIVSWQFVGAVVGGFAWGAFSDRFGRRPAAIGFVGGALAVITYLYVLQTPAQLRLAGAAWGFLITASVVWAPWMSELFPSHLRSTGMSIFNWGRIISMTAPLLTAAVAKAHGMESAMVLSAGAFGAGAVVWLLLPETVGRKATAP